jgi:imidazolonepropionase-like amidohydrolase
LSPRGAPPGQPWGGRDQVRGNRRRALQHQGWTRPAIHRRRNPLDHRNGPSPGPARRYAHGAAGINAALEAGVDSIEHGSFLDARSLELFIAKGAFHVPTIIAGVTVLEMAQADGLLTPAQIEKAMIVGVKIKEALARSHKAGVTIAFGTDMGVGPHGQNAREFGFMVEAGMGSREAIKAATVNAAKLLDLSDEVGTIASGKSAVSLR